MGDRGNEAEKRQLAERKAKYSRIKLLLKEPGWKDLAEIIEEKYHEALDRLKSPKFPGEDERARGALMLIDSIFEKLESELAFGKDAEDRYVAKYVKQSPEGDQK